MTSTRSIRFFTEDINYKLSHKARLRAWIHRIIDGERYTLHGLNYIFCSDDYLLQLNAKHLNHQTYTDIITFDNSDSPGQVEGDIFISIDRVRDNAEKMGLPFEAELHRVMVHGVLHLMDYADKSREEKCLMREKEDACLSLLEI